MYLFQKIDECTIHNDARKNIAEFLINERSHVQSYSMQDIARMTYTSKSTLSRFAQNLGFEGWIDFIDAFVSECHYMESHFSNIDPNLPFNQSDNLEEIVHKVCELQIESLKDTLDLMDLYALQKAGDFILNSDKVVIFSLSPNKYLADLFARKMKTIGKLIYICDSDEGGMAAASLTEKDTAIIISYSGNNPNRIPTKYLDSLKNNHVKIIGVTSEGENLLRNSSNVCLTISSRERLYSKIASYATEESINFILNSLFSYCFSKNFQLNYSEKLIKFRELEQERQTNLVEMKEEGFEIKEN